MADRPRHLLPAVAQARTYVAAGLGSAACTADATCNANLTGALATLDAVQAGIAGPGGLREKTQEATNGLGQVSGGLGTAIAGVGTGSTPGATTLRGGLAQVAGGLTQSATGLAQLTTGVTLVKAGLSNPGCDTSNPTNAVNPCGLREGLTLLSEGLLSAVGGVTQLSAGSATAATGSGTLAEKIAEAGDGAKQLAAGSRDAEVGSKRLADGLVDGAQRLSDEGTKVLVEAGNDTALDFGERYAMIAHMAEMTEDGGLPYGAPEGATGSAAYSFELAAATHEGSRNLTRGLLAVGALGLGALLSSVVRARFF